MLKYKKSLIFIAMCFLFVCFFGISVEPYNSQDNYRLLPSIFIKKSPSLSIVFYIPIIPADIMNKNLDLDNKVLDDFKYYCKVRFGVDEKKCINILYDKLHERGFYSLKTEGG